MSSEQTTEWLQQALAACTLTEEVEEYLLGRGAKPETIRAERMVTWSSAPTACPDPDFSKRYGSRGEKLSGFMVCPVRSPRGRLLGFEARNINVKVIQDFRLPESKWTPFMLGTRRALPKIWAGGDVWITEGLFDLCPLEWLVPPGDAVLATVRAHLGRMHVEFLRRFCRGWVHMVYDRDGTGRKATTGFREDTGKWMPGALENLERVGLRCTDVTYSGGKDPGEIWDKGGVTGLRAAFRM